MKSFSIHAAALLLACVSSMASAYTPPPDITPFQGENLLVSVPDGWTQVTATTKGAMVMSEWVPNGQTADNWQQMITVQVCHGLGHVSPKTFVEAMNRDVQSQVEQGTFQQQTLDMPANTKYPSFGVAWLSGKVKSTGKGEITLIRAIQGKDSLYVIQKAWRQAPFKHVDRLEVTPEALQKGVEFLKEAKVVDSRK